MSNTETFRLGVDIGGTFTDVVLEGPDTFASVKVLTTYAAPENAILEGMAAVCAKAGVQPNQISQMIHGTTLATNALIERKGAKTALITTQGFRDVIEMRTESRFEQYDLNLQLPAPLLPRNRRYTVQERLDARGQVLTPLDINEIKALAETLKAASYESIAIGLLHAYANPDHERAVAEVLRAALPEVHLSLSSDVSPQMREYERFNTTVANAYIKPLMKSYLSRLADRLAAQGMGGDIFLMHSGGGLMSLGDAAEFPVRLVESGPAGGAVFAAHLAGAYGLDKVLSFDMGGTTAKICLIKHQTPKTARVFEVARTSGFKKGSGMPISIPVIDMVEIGAGGGSLGHVDSLSQIRVGPKSAGSEPGPASYGRGGTHPGVTDADLVLGKLRPEGFAGGSIDLDVAAATAALQSHIGQRLDMDAAQAAHGMAEVVDENMANAARVHAVENGEDLSGYTMIAFGGAAPLHAGRLCEKLGIKTCLVPAGAGVGSAIGFLRAPFSFEATRSSYMALDDFDSDQVQEIFRSLAKEAQGFVRACTSTQTIDTEFRAYMRYKGQGWEIPVAVSADMAATPTAEAFRQAFEAAYVALFSRTVAGLAIEIAIWTAKATTRPAQPAAVAIQDLQHTAAAKADRRIFDPALGAYEHGVEVARAALTPGVGVSGPAAIVERETTLIIPASRQVTGQNDGTLRMTPRVKEQTILEGGAA